MSKKLSEPDSTSRCVMTSCLSASEKAFSSKRSLGNHRPCEWFLLGIERKIAFSKSTALPPISSIKGWDAPPLGVNGCAGVKTKLFQILSIFVDWLDKDASGFLRNLYQTHYVNMIETVSSTAESTSVWVEFFDEARLSVTYRILAPSEITVVEGEPMAFSGVGASRSINRRTSVGSGSFTRAERLRPGPVKIRYALLGGCSSTPKLYLDLLSP
ncbi:hypothetical protein Tco_1057666 [Tanacetum coccineum]|uniref:Uncharacterized protein n=1 Tax=Tanacetum coccineum TaxID=301880 RepID=A0ABQ5H7F7_9ASTR